MKEATGTPCYLSAASPPSQYPPRHFCEICGYPVIMCNKGFLTVRDLAKYRCIVCGSRFCSIPCKGKHEETKCNKHK